MNRVFLAGPVVEYDEEGIVIASDIRSEEANIYIYCNDFKERLGKNANSPESCNIWADVDAMLLCDEDGELYLEPIHIDIFSESLEGDGVLMN